MKKTLIALAALGAMAGAAQAQSTVTIYGLLDANFQSFKTNVAAGAGATATLQSLTQTKIDSGGLNGSRWGIRVSEDIGGGMAVIGNLESGFDISTGASSQGALFGRRANVGISSGFGTVTIGRNTSSYDDVAADHAMMAATIFDPSNTNNGNSITTLTALAGATTAAAATPVPTPAAAAALRGALVNVGAAFLSRNTTWLGYQTRFNNSVKYISPNFSGFSGSVMYALGEDKTPGVGAVAGTNASKTVSANLKFVNGPLLVSGGYQSEGFSRAAGGTPALENSLISVAYDFGVAKVGAGFNRAKYKDVVAGTSMAAQKEWNLSVAVPLGATTLSAGYAQSKGDDFGKSTGYGIQALYSLSKRTTLYAGAQSTKTYDNIVNLINLFNAATPATASSIGRVTTYGAGIRHTF
jgi:predicted porin